MALSQVEINTAKTNDYGVVLNEPNSRLDLSEKTQPIIMNIEDKSMTSSINLDPAKTSHAPETTNNLISNTNINQISNPTINQGIKETNNNELCDSELKLNSVTTNIANFGTTSSPTAVSTTGGPDTLASSLPAFGTATITRVPAIANNQKFGIPTNQTFGTTNNQSFGATDNSSAFGVGYGAMSITNPANTQPFGILSSVGTAANTCFGNTGTLTAPTTGNNQTFGTNQAFGVINHQNPVVTNNSNVFGMPFGTMNAINTTNSMTFGIASSATGISGGQGTSVTSSPAFGVSTTTPAPSTNQTFGTTHRSFDIPINLNGANTNSNNLGFGFGSRSGTNTANPQASGDDSAAGASGTQFGSIGPTHRGNTFGINTNQRCFNFPNNNVSRNPTDHGTLGTTTINIDEPIVITGYNDQIGFFSSPQSGLYGTPFNGAEKLSTTNITVHQPITIKQTSDQSGFNFGIPNQPQTTYGQFGIPVTTTTANGTLSTTNITVKKPITISGPLNTFKFGINPTPANQFGYFNNASTMKSALEKMCTTNITVNKPISISGTLGHNPYCINNCNCRRH